MPRPRIPPKVLEQARRQALKAADEELPPRAPGKEQRIKEKVVAALKRLHPMD